MADKHPPRPVALACENVSVRFRGLKALTDVSMTLPEGTITGLIGPNGAGKTTLVNVLSGLIAPTSGRLRLRGEQVKRWSLSTAARHGVARTFQASRVFSDRLVDDNVRLSPVRRHRPERMSPLEAVGLDDERYRLAGTLAYGELRRLGVAIALSTHPDVILLDEPGAGLTASDLDRLGEAITRIRDMGTTVLLVDHNMRFLMSAVDRVVVLESGIVIAEGSPAEVQSDERVREAYLGGGGHDS